MGSRNQPNQVAQLEDTAKCIESNFPIYLQYEFSYLVTIAFSNNYHG